MLVRKIKFHFSGAFLFFRVLNRLIYAASYWFGCQVYRPLKIYAPKGYPKISPTASVKYPENIEVGENVFINHNCCIWGAIGAKIMIGDNVLFGPGVVVVCSNHGISLGQLICNQVEYAADVVIGSDVWVGANTVILPGVTIGDGCVIGAGSVVTKDMPGNYICAGVPAKVIRVRGGDGK